MRDLIWTVIIIWVVFKVFNLFKSVTVKKTVIVNNSSDQRDSYNKSEGSVSVDVTNAYVGKSPKHNPSDGEYVDYEEIK